MTIPWHAMQPIERESKRIPFPVRSDYANEQEYEKARRMAGLACCACGTAIILPERRGQVLCGPCLTANTLKEWTNTRAIRCPCCRQLQEIIEFRNFIEWTGTLPIGRLSWQCGCGYIFEVQVEQELYFTSPALLPVLGVENAQPTETAEE